MFDKLGKQQKIIIYFFILISFVFILPIIFWLGFFIGYRYCVISIDESLGLENPIDSEPDMDDSYLEINID